MSPINPTDDAREQKIAKAEDQASTSQEQQGDACSSDAEGELDLESLDLTVEPIEERISPGETNVFDK